MTSDTDEGLDSGDGLYMREDGDYIAAHIVSGDIDDKVATIHQGAVKEEPDRMEQFTALCKAIYTDIAKEIIKRKSDTWFRGLH
jgi:hypothetical protein